MFQRNNDGIELAELGQVDQLEQSVNLVNLLRNRLGQDQLLLVERNQHGRRRARRQHRIGSLSAAQTCGFGPGAAPAVVHHLLEQLDRLGRGDVLNGNLQRRARIVTGRTEQITQLKVFANVDDLPEDGHRVGVPVRRRAHVIGHEVADGLEIIDRAGFRRVEKHSHFVIIKLGGLEALQRRLDAIGRQVTRHIAHQHDLEDIPRAQHPENLLVVE